MLTMKILAKTIGVSIAAFVALVVAVVVLLAAGVPQAIVALATWVSLAALGYCKSKALWDSRRPWAWALAGFFLGVLAFPVFWFCYEHHRATGEEVEILPEAGRTAQPGVAAGPGPSLPEGVALQSRSMTH